MVLDGFFDMYAGPTQVTGLDRGDLKVRDVKWVDGGGGGGDVDAVPKMSGGFPMYSGTVCRKFLEAWFGCLMDNDKKMEKCRSVALKYFQCRMEEELTEDQDWDTLSAFRKIKDDL